jgi:hypothetical protein
VRMPCYCAKCASNLGYRPARPTTDFLQTEFKKQKHTKHTVSSSSYPVQSVFDEPSEAYYVQTLDEAYQNGAIEVSSRGTDILFCPSTQSSIGYKQAWGGHVTRQDTVRVADSTDALKVHGYLNASSDHSHKRCDGCGGPLFG